MCNVPGMTFSMVTLARSVLAQVPMRLRLRRPRQWKTELNVSHATPSPPSSNGLRRPPDQQHVPQTRRHAVPELIAKHVRAHKTNLKE